MNTGNFSHLHFRNKQTEVLQVHVWTPEMGRLSGVVSWQYSPAIDASTLYAIIPQVIRAAVGKGSFHEVATVFSVKVSGMTHHWTSFTCINHHQSSLTTTIAIILPSFSGAGRASGAFRLGMAKIFRNLCKWHHRFSAAWMGRSRSIPWCGS